MFLGKLERLSVEIGDLFGASHHGSGSTRHRSQPTTSPTAIRNTEDSAIFTLDSFDATTHACHAQQEHRTARDGDDRVRKTQEWGRIEG